ncbi:ATP-binding cassette domain-containing protein, partial [Bdellovibrionota bacterium]
GTFSFNVDGGRCEACSGEGYIKVEMHFMADIYLLCEECEGSRYKRETLDVTYKGKSIADVLNMTFSEARVFFQYLKNTRDVFQLMVDVGLGYLRLGQPANTLSGGEAQRLKIARELSSKKKKKQLYLLDEPTTGLHSHDISLLIRVLNNLVDQQNSVVVIEHNLDFVKASDWIIDLGPEGGEKGGELVVEGTPEQVAEETRSHTGGYLAPLLK